jgi:hypothetical protein
VQCAVIGLVGLAVLVGVARVLRVGEITDVVGTVTRRLGR